MDNGSSKTYGKRDRSARSSNESDLTPEHKRQNITTTKHYCLDLDTDSESSCDSGGENNIDTPKISTFFIPLQLIMAESVAPWLSVTNELLSSIQELNCSMNASMKRMSEDLSKQIEDLVESNRFLEESFKDVKVEATEAIQQVKTLTIKVELQNITIE